MIASGIYINEERRKTYDGARYMTSATVIVTEAGDTSITGPRSLSGKTLALEAGMYHREECVDPLNKELVAKGLPPVVAQDYPAQQGAYQQIMIGRVVLQVRRMVLRDDGVLSRHRLGLYGHPIRNRAAPSLIP